MQYAPLSDQRPAVGAAGSVRGVPQAANSPTRLLRQPGTADNATTTNYRGYGKKSVVAETDRWEGDVKLARPRIDSIAWSDHARVQYHQRGTSEDPPEVAKEKSGLVSERSDAVDSDLSYGAEELLYYRPPEGRDLLFPVRDSVITTALFARPYRLDTAGLRRCTRCGAFSDIVVSGGCSYCSENVKRIQEV